MGPESSMLAFESRKKSVALGVILNCFFPGASSFYCGRTGRAFGILFLAVFLSILAILTLGLAIPLVWLWLIYDGYSVVEKYNRELAASLSPSVQSPRPVVSGF